MGRSTAYPLHDLKEAVSRLEKIMKNTGFGPFSRESAVTGMGYKGVSGTSGRSFSALQQYGLITRVSEDNYKISDIGKRIITPMDDHDKDKALVLAASNPKLYMRLDDLFQEGHIPEKLDNYLINQPEFKFANKKAASEAARNYALNKEYLGGRSGDNEQNLPPKVAPQPLGQNFDELQGSKNGSNEQHGNTIQRALPSGIRIEFPEALDSAVLFGDFGPEMKALEKKAQELLGGDSKDNEKEE